MANIKVEALKSAFRELGQKGAKSIWRYEREPERLMKEGFRESTYITAGEPTGLYWGPSRRKAAEAAFAGDLGRYSKLRKTTPVIEGKVLPSTKIKELNEAEFSDLVKESNFDTKTITNRLRRLADIVIVPDITPPYGTGTSQVLQLRPNKVIAKYKDIYRILGLTGALGGAATAMEPKEAEASPVGKMIKAGTKVAKTAIKETPSRTSTLLKGTEYMGQQIKKITKGRGDWRHVVLEDGTVYPVTKDVASDLVRHQGTVEKMTEFGLRKPSGPSAVMGQASQIDQAFKSLAYHESRSNPYLPRKTIQENYKSYLGQVKEQGLGEAVPYSLVKRGGKTFTMPTPYAQLLEKEGHLKIMKELK
jgi:hypothetical protein